MYGPHIAYFHEGPPLVSFFIPRNLSGLIDRGVPHTSRAGIIEYEKK